MIHDYPYTDFHELNLDYILKLCRETMGLHFEQSGKFLKLVNQAGEEVSKVIIAYAETALKDDLGNNINAYIIRGNVDGDNVVLTKGNGEVITLTIPYAVKAENDVNNNPLTSYIKGLGVSGNKLLVTYGNGTTYSFTVPFATKAGSDANGKLITSYVAELTTGNDKLIIKDGDNNIIAELTIPYAEKALSDVDGDEIKSTYGKTLFADVTTISLRAKDGTTLSTITVPYAVKALSDTEGNELLSAYGYNLAVNGNKVGIVAHNGTLLNEITIPFATLATDATNAIENVSISGDNVVFTTYGGESIRITVPYAVKALKDDLNNTLTHAYVANVSNDPDTGKITFYAQDGTVLAEMIPTFDKAIHDSYNNVIADYIKSIVTSPDNDYMLVTHGTGEAETITIHYATRAWKDTYNNIIGNTYIRRLACIVDEDTNHYSLVAYNGELSELFRIELRAYMAQVDENEKAITSYVAGVAVDVTDAEIINITDGNGNVINTIQLTATTENVSEVTTLPTALYDATTQTVTFDSGTVVNKTVVGNVEFT